MTGVGSPDGWLWTRITPGGIDPHRVAEQLADADQRSRHVALVDGRDAQDVVLGVEQHDPELLAFEPSHLQDEPVGDVVRSADRPASSRPVGHQAASELERGDELGGLRRADAGDRPELQLRRAGQPGQAVVPGERVGGEVERGPPARARAPQQPDQLGRRQATHAAQGESLARSLGDRHLADGSAGPGSSVRPFVCPGHAIPPSIPDGDGASPRPVRREPADSPRHPDLEDVAQPIGEASPAGQPVVHRDLRERSCSAAWSADGGPA